MAAINKLPLLENATELIEDIIFDMESGTNKHDCLVWHLKHSNIYPGDFNILWYEAEKRLGLTVKTNAVSLINSAVYEAQTNFGRILTQDERKIILSDIASGRLVVTKPMVVAGTLVDAYAPPSYTDRGKAIAELNKMDGSYASIKFDTVTTTTEVELTQQERLESIETIRRELGL